MAMRIPKRQERHAPKVLKKAALLTSLCFSEEERRVIQK